MLLAVLMLIFGIFALAKGEFKITNKKKVKGSTGRILGAVLIVGALGGFIPGMGAFIQIGTLLIVIVAGLATSEKIEDKHPVPNIPN
jgi:hypothetical protein